MAVVPHAPRRPARSLPPVALAGVARFVLGPGALVGAAGLLHRGDPTIAAPAVDWRQARVDVVVPVCRDQATIVLCLAGLHAQTLRPRRIVLVEDCEGGRDGTIVLAREFASTNGLRLEVIEQRGAGGRAATLRTQAAALDGDVMVVLDAHVVLESGDYLERCVRELYQGSGVASVCGVLLPLRDRDRRRWAMSDAFRRWLGGDPHHDPLAARGVAQRSARWFADGYRECAALVQQRFVQRGQMRAFGSICHPVGVVAYRRRYLQALFERHADSDAAAGGGIPACPGSEDVLIGFALAHQGFRAVQVPDVIARAQAAPAIALGAALRARYAQTFLDTGTRFAPLLRPPLHGPGRWWRHRAPVERRAAEPYRQAFGGERTEADGRPVGWAFACTLLDKIAVPALVLVLMLAGLWQLLAWTLAAELAAWLAVLAVVAPGRRSHAVATGLAVAPLRYLDMAADAVGVMRFLVRRLHAVAMR